MKTAALLVLVSGAALAQLGGGLQFPWPSPVAALGPVTGMRFWYSADCITYSGSVCSVPSNGSTLTTWDDRSGNALTATVQTGTCTFNTSQINGQPAVAFSSCGLTNANTALYGAVNIFAVFKRSSSTGKGVFVAGVSGGLSGSSLKYWTDTGFMQGMDMSQVIQIGHGSSSPDTSWHQGNTAYTNNVETLAFRLDRASDGGTITGNDAVSRATTSVGYDRNGSGTEFFPGDIAEIIFYGSGPGGTPALTSPQITQVENYLFAKYGL